MVIALTDIPFGDYALLASPVLFSFLAGYFFGKENPDWTSDRSLEGDNLRELRGYGYYGYSHSEDGCCLLGMLLGAGGVRSFLPLVFAVLALISIFLQFDDPSGGVGDYSWFFLLFHKPLWLALAGGTTGYIIARVTDKGPVGPLE